MMRATRVRSPPAATGWGFVLASGDRELEIVVWGATGFTGRLVAEYLLERYGTESFRWALGGRQLRKLESVRDALGPAAAVLPLVTGDAADPGSMAALACRTRVVCTTVGPRIGSISSRQGREAELCQPRSSTGASSRTAT